jgi:hypothetical protein
LFLPGAKARQGIAGQPASLLQEAQRIRQGCAGCTGERRGQLILQTRQGLPRRRASLAHQQVDFIQARTRAGQLPFCLRGCIPDQPATRLLCGQLERIEGRVRQAVGGGGAGSAQDGDNQHGNNQPGQLGEAGPAAHTVRGDRSVGEYAPPQDSILARRVARWRQGLHQSIHALRLRQGQGARRAPGRMILHLALLSQRQLTINGY